MRINLSDKKERLERLEQIELPENTRMKPSKAYCGALQVEIADIKEIHEIRKTTGLKINFQRSFYAYGQIVSVWEDPENLITVWHECAPEDYPDELKKNSTCEWVRETITEETMSLKCEV